MKSIQNTLKIEEKFSDVPQKFRVGPKKVGSVGFPETIQFCFWPNNSKLKDICFPAPSDCQSFVKM